MTYNPRFSKTLYVVPTTDAEGNTYNPGGSDEAAVSDDILAGGSIFSTGTTLQTNANGVASTARGFIPVNAPTQEYNYGEVNGVTTMARGSGYGTAAITGRATTGGNGSGLTVDFTPTAGGELPDTITVNGNPATDGNTYLDGDILTVTGGTRNGSIRVNVVYNDDSEAEQRLQCNKMVGSQATAVGGQRVDADGDAEAGPDGSTFINVMVYGNVRT